MANFRTFYGCESVGITTFPSPGTYAAVRGAQSVGVSTRFNLQQVFEIGQLEVYELVEDLPDLEVTLEKCLDGYCPAYLLATENATDSTLLARSAVRCTMSLSIFSDQVSPASGTPIKQCEMSGLYVSQVGYNFPTDGPATESLSFVGNNKVWKTGSFTFSGFTTAHGVSSFSPAAASGVNFRQDVVMTGCLWPTQIPGITSSGTNPDNGQASGFAAHIQGLRTSANLGRQQLLELGRKAPFLRYADFPIEVTTTIDVLSTEGDAISATEDGVFGGGSNLVDQSIKVQLNEGLVLDLGTKNKLQGVSMSGGDATSKGNQTCSYTFVGYNSMRVQHAADVTVALRPA